ncbi:hypothetical protein EYF80_007710 [Liparis tanakae]|uniref:Uncharacterized protein n=1 Tax=Liparis tanakae TaxID=230148 RepID=A0A4Z2IWZ3_9TELE|nr:hypothetical protein EYF80_007710 [Liparis tanakae]
MKDSWSLANCGAARSMKGLTGRPWLDSSSPCHEYLWGAGGHEESISPPGVVVVVHRSGHIKGHELQSRNEA